MMMSLKFRSDGMQPFQTQALSVSAVDFATVKLWSGEKCTTRYTASESMATNGHRTGAALAAPCRGTISSRLPKHWMLVHTWLLSLSSRIAATDGRASECTKSHKQPSILLLGSRYYRLLVIYRSALGATHYPVQRFAVDFQIFLER